MLSTRRLEHCPDVFNNALLSWLSSISALTFRDTASPAPVPQLQGRHVAVSVSVLVLVLVLNSSASPSLPRPKTASDLSQPDATMASANLNFITFNQDHSCLAVGQCRAPSPVAVICRPVAWMPPLYPTHVANVPRHRHL